MRAGGWRSLPLDIRAMAGAVALCLALMSASGCHRARATDHVLSLQASAESVAERGICSVSVDDGITQLDVRSGKPCIVNLPGTAEEGRYLYLQILDDSLKTGRAIYAVVRYYDEVRADPIELQYDTSGDAYRRAVLLSGGQYRRTRRWRTAVFRMDALRLAGGQNGGADLRLYGRHLCIEALAVSADLKRAPAALAGAKS